MGTDVYGYVKISTVELCDEDLWFDILNIDVIAEQNYCIFGRLLGVRANEEIVPIAPDK